MAQEVFDPTGFPTTSVGSEQGFRASDADRLATVMVLQDAMARGLLNPDESSERMAQAFAAVHRRELDPLTVDLTPAPATHSGAPGWRALAGMAVEQLRLSLGGSATGVLSRAGVAVALLITVLLVLAVGMITADFVLNAWSTPGPRGFGHH